VLCRLRNEIPINGLIRRLDLLRMTRDGQLRIVWPRFREYDTATNPRTNLARCFRWETDFNPIDLVMTMHAVPFFEAVRYLQRQEFRFLYDRQTHRWS